MKDAAFACRPLAVLVTGAAAALPFAADAKVPLVPGDAFHYAFTSDSTIDEPGRAPGHSSATGTFSETVSGGASFGGRKNLTKLHYSFTETAFADGSYRWSEDLSFTTGNVRGTGSVASDGSAKLTSSLPGYNAGTATYGTPLARKTGFAIPVTSQGFNQLPAPPLKSHTVDVPDWYPGNALVPRPLRVETETDAGRTITPPACGRRAGIAALDLHRVVRSLDPLVGSVEVTTTDEFDVAARAPGDAA